MAFLILGSVGCQDAQELAVLDPPTAVSANSNVVPSIPTDNETAVSPLPTNPPPPQPTPLPTTTPLPYPTATPMPLPVFTNPQLDSMAQETAVLGAEFVLLDASNTGVWQFVENSFVHPIGLEVRDNKAYVLDGGRVLMIDLARPAPPQTILAPDTDIDGVRVIEPLDLTLTEGGILVLDRAGDVYRYEFQSRRWSVDRYDRPVEAASGHYFVALTAPIAPQFDQTLQHTLLETNYKYVLQYGRSQTPLWNLPEARSVDVSERDNRVYVLQREMHDSKGTLKMYQDTSWIWAFKPNLVIESPRQVVATETAVYVLDHNGTRLLALDPLKGYLIRTYQLPQDGSVSAIWASDSGQHLILTGRSRLYFVNQPEFLAAIPGDYALDGIQLHDPRFLAELTDFRMPIGGSNITPRDFQLPGAPRHYRLGVHNGIDFYWQPGTQILAAADGTIIRAELAYIPPTQADIANWWADNQARGYTAAETLDNYRGRQVWIQHPNGLISRYAHLSSIAPGIAEGVEVVRGQPVGAVGNSGSPASLESESSDAHLHFEMWLDDHYVGQYLRPIEVREWVEKILVN